MILIVDKTDSPTLLSVVGGDRFVAGGDVETQFDGHMVTDIPQPFDDDVVELLAEAARGADFEVREVPESGT